MSGTIRIAQISDLLISAGLEAEERRLERLADFIKRNRHPTSRLDYLVVCGNVTADGTGESFALASDFISKLAYDILERRDFSIDPKRLLVVPGSNDIQAAGQDSPDYTRFTQFYQQIFSDERWLYKGDTFDPLKATLRHLKDLTLIGLTFWGEGGEDDLAGLQEQFESIRASGPLQFKYLKRTPTLLVSTGLPPISRLALTRREFRDLISFARENLGTTLHLFGAGDYELIPPQLSGFKHLCLGTGPQALCPPGTSPPFRVNFIDLPSPDGPPGDAELRTRISLYRRRTPEATPEHRAYGADELRPWIYTPPAPPPLPDIHSLLQSRLRAKIDWKDSQLIWVYGLPGNGRFRPFEQEHPLLSPEGQPVPCFTQELKGSEEQALQALQELKRQIREAAPRNQKIVVVIRDLLLDGMMPGTRDKYQDRIGKELTFLTRLKHTLFYISNALGETIDYDLELEGFYNKDTLICQPLDTVMMEALDAHYSHRLPLYRERVDYLSGRYAGLSLEIFEWAERVFKEWPGAEQIRPEACGILLTAALHPETANGSLPNAYLLAAHIYHTLTRTPIGIIVVKFIQSKVLQSKIDVNWLRAGAERKVVSFSRQEIFDEIHQENPLILNFLDSLVRHSILSQPTEDEYRVRAVAPFLIDLRWAPSLAAVQEPPKPKSRFLAFLSYRSVSSNEAHRIATILRKAYEGLGGLDLFLFEDVQRDPASIEERINRELLARRNLIILHEGGMRFGGDGWQEREIYFWRQTWGPKEGAEAGISVYVKTSEITLPLSLANQNVLSLALANDETIFGHVEGRLIPEYGVEPGLRPQHGLGFSEAGRG